MNATIRRSRAEDDPALVALSARAAVQAPLTICAERSPSFFALRDLRGRSHTLVAERSGHVVGCVSVTTRRVRWNSESRAVDYVADLKVLPTERRAGVGRALVGAVVRDATRVLVWTSAIGNDPLSGLLSASAVSATPLARFNAVQLLPLFACSRALAGVTPARPSDEAELRALLDTEFRRRTLAPVVEDRADVAGIHLDRYLLIRRAGRIVAALAIWEGSSSKQTRLVRMTRSLRVLRRATTLLNGRFTLPTEGSLLRFQCVRNAACRDDAVDALGALFRAALQQAARRRDHFLLFGCDARDPLARAFTRIPRLTYRYELHTSHPVTPDPLYFDDPALS